MGLLDDIFGTADSDGPSTSGTDGECSHSDWKAVDVDASEGWIIKECCACGKQRKASI